MNYMSEAIKQAEKAIKKDEVPIGAVIVDSKTGKIISRAHNLVQSSKDATAHAELLAIKKACKKKKSKYLNDCDLYVTLEPCNMCAGAISLAKIRELHFSAEDKKSGAVVNGTKFFSQSTCHHAPKVIQGEMSDISSFILKNFFKGKR